MKLRIALILVVLALVAGVAYRINSLEGGADRQGGGDRALTVRTVPVVVRDFPRVIDLPGTLEAAQQVAIVAQVSGTVLQQHVQEGDAVRAGQVLFSLDDRQAKARMAQSEAALGGALAEIAEAEARIERLSPLMASSYISRQEFADAQLALESVRARAGTARAARDEARLDVQHAQIRAPIAGRVGRIGVRVGSLVQAGGDALTTILAPGTLDVRASVAQQNWAELAAARAQGRVLAEVYAGGERAAAVRGELVFADAQIDAATGTVPIKVRLLEPSSALLSGQSVHLRLLLGSMPGGRIIPEAALQFAQSGAYVYVVRDGKAVVQPVQLIRSVDGELMVEGELAAGEPVLVEVPKRLRAGGAVKLEGGRG